MPSPLVLCPKCGNRFKAIRCGCKGFIVNAEAWKLGRWDWSWMSRCFADGIRPSDIDAIIERRGQFLAIETKGMGADLPIGQSRLLHELARLPQFTVITLWGNTDDPEYMQIVGETQRTPVNRDTVESFVQNWFQWASSQAAVLA